MVHLEHHMEKLKAYFSNYTLGEIVFAASCVAVFLVRGASTGVFYFLCGGVYLMPYFLAVKRRHSNAPAIGALNFLLGWTFLGWVGAMVWAFTSSVGPSGD
jgi:hypothetical protein